MTNNDIMRRIRYIFDFNDSRMMALCGLAGQPQARELISDWLKREDDPAYKACGDREMATFLNGLISYRRGEREGPSPEPEQRLTNNIIFMKLKIALDLKAEEVLAVLALGGMTISKHELSAFFRKPGHKHYRECKDQILRNFLNGLRITYREQAGPDAATATASQV